MDKEKIIRDAESEVMPYLLKFYTPGSELFELLLIHSRQVARKALTCMEKRNIALDAASVARAALLHDIGIVKCNASGIHCMGTEPYIRHGVLGREMLEPFGLEAEAMVCERHTGSGITALEIEQTQMPLPIRDMVPVTMLEKLVCYADKFFSKSGDPLKEKSPAKIRVALSRFGSGSLERFDALHAMFGY